MKYDFDCIVIGAGIAGMTAALYLKRANVNVIIIESGAPGGKLNTVRDIDNYPGFKNITGPDLAYKVYEQIQDLGIEIKYGNVLKIEDHIITTDIEKITANKIVIATGRTSKKTNLSSNFTNVSYCSVCDANLYKDKTVAILGIKEVIIEEALYLSNLVNKLIVFPANAIIKKDQLDRENIEIINDCVIHNLKGDNKILKEMITSQGNFFVDGLFIALGSDPAVNFLDALKKENNYIVVDKTMQTSINYIYACGDVIKKDLYQISTAIGEAAIAAISVKKSL